jgi:glycerate dehydrogenase
LIDAGVFQAMKPDAVLINTARGAIINGQDLANALREGVIAGAAVDTLSQEPPPADHVLLAPDIPGLLVTPHNAWASKRARQTALDQLADVICAFADGQIINQVEHDG